MRGLLIAAALLAAPAANTGKLYEVDGPASA